jgi:gamma-glutamylcyclotransferase (GGCT)/AIG2-like uncharacterized protein YtfP
MHRRPRPRKATAVIPYFAYGTTQQGFPHHRELYDLLGEPVGRHRTVEPYAIVVPHEAACNNPGCRFVHRMAALVPFEGDLHAEGDVFLVSEAALAALDRLELSGPYTRETVVVGEYAAQAYPVREPDRWVELVRRGRAAALPAYPRELANAVNTLKPCCEASPGHPPPHDVIEPS